MSYILDALKKAEQQRRLGQLPDVFDVSETDQEGTHDKKVWVLFFASVLLFTSVGILAWLYMRDNNQETTDNASVVAPLHQPDVSRSIIAEKKQQSSASQPGDPAVSEPDAEVAPPVTADRGDTDTTAKPSTSGLTDSEKDAIKLAKERGWTIIAPSARPVPDKPIVRPEVEDRPIISINELPPASRNSLPKMEFTGHFYSSEARLRKVTINNRTFSEGQEISPGLVLHAITPKGAVFDYEGRRFSLAMFQNWPG